MLVFISIPMQLLILKVKRNDCLIGKALDLKQKESHLLPYTLNQRCLIGPR